MYDGAGLSPTGASTAGQPVFLNNTFERRVVFGVTSDVYNTYTPQVDYFTQPNLPHLNRFFLSQDAQRGSMFTPQIDIKTFNQFRLIGMEFDYEPVSDKTRR